MIIEQQAFDYYYYYYHYNHYYYYHYYWVSDTNGACYCPHNIILLSNIPTVPTPKIYINLLLRSTLITNIYEVYPRTFEIHYRILHAGALFPVFTCVSNVADTYLHTSLRFRRDLLQCTLQPYQLISSSLLTPLSISYTCACPTALPCCLHNITCELSKQTFHKLFGISFLYKHLLYIYIYILLYKGMSK